jgi:hypothetical protein
MDTAITNTFCCHEFADSDPLGNTCGGSLDLLATNVVEHVQLSDLSGLDWLSWFAVGNRVTGVELSVKHSSDAHLALEVVVINVGNEHLKWVILVNLG